MFFRCITVQISNLDTLTLCSVDVSLWVGVWMCKRLQPFENNVARILKWNQMKNHLTYIKKTKLEKKKLRILSEFPIWYQSKALIGPLIYDFNELKTVNEPLSCSVAQKTKCPILSIKLLKIKPINIYKIKNI